MKKLTSKMLSKTADFALKAAKTASGLASMAGTYQPKEPQMLKKICK